MSDEDEDAREKLVANERIKFTSTYANGLAVAIFAVVRAVHLDCAIG